MPTAGSNERPWPGWWRSALGRRYAAVFALLVSLPLLAYAAWSAAQVYRQQRDALAAVQTAQADAAAARIQRFLREIELQLSWQPEQRKLQFCYRLDGETASSGRVKL